MEKSLMKEKLEFLISSLDYHLKEAWIDQTKIEVILHNVISDYSAVFHALEFVSIDLEERRVGNKND